MSVISFERNGSYGNAALTLKKFCFIKIPIRDESDDYNLTVFRSV